jgi:hypothetical protein
MKLNIFTYLLIFSLLLISKSDDTPCTEDEFNTQKEQKKNIIPLLNGRCCKSKDDKNSVPVFKEKLSLFKIQNEKLNCNTYVEECLNINLNENILNSSKCTSINSEIPYKCCYIKYKEQAACYPLDIHKKKYFNWYKTFFRTQYGLFDDEEINIICYSNFNKISFLLLLLIFFL